LTNDVKSEKNIIYDPNWAKIDFLIKIFSDREATAEYFEPSVKIPLNPPL
jgi:hypothetical protein